MLIHRSIESIATKRAPSHCSRTPRCRSGWMFARNRTSHCCAAGESLGSKCSNTLSSVTCVSRVLRPEWYSPFQKKVLPPAMRSTSSVIVAARAQRLPGGVVEVLADGADHADLVEERRGEREVGGGAAEHPVARPGRGDDGVIGDGSDDSEAHAAARVAFGPRRARDPATGVRWAGGAASSSSSPSRSCGAGRGADRRHARRRELRRHPSAPQRVPGRERAAARARRGGRGRARATPASASSR